MDGDAQFLGRAGDDRVDDVDIGLEQILPIVAARAQQLARAVVAELDERGLVDLQIGAARIGERLHFLVVGGDEVGPEIVEIGIDLAADMVAAGAVVDIGRAGQRHLGRALGQRLEEREVARVARALPCDLARHLGDAARHAVAMRVGLAPALLLAERDGDARDARGGEGIGIGVAAELAVGDGLEPHLLLHRHDIANRLVLLGAQLLVVDPVDVVLDARLEEMRRAQQAADMVGAEGGRGMGHGGLAYTICVVIIRRRPSVRNEGARNVVAPCVVRG